MVYSTYLGGSKDDYGSGIAVDTSGNVYVTGQTYSADFPNDAIIQESYIGASDVFVTKIDSSGSILSYSTYLGGSNADAGYSIAVDNSGNAYVTGTTYSSDFPIRYPVQEIFGGEYDAFVAKIDSSGSILTYSTYLGGSREEVGFSIVVDDFENAYITGFTGSDNFPTTLPMQDSNAGDNDVFITKIDSSGPSVSYSTYWGGSDAEDGFDIAVDTDGNAYITGNTYSTDFPTISPIQENNAGGLDAFIIKVDSCGSNISYSSYLGRSGHDHGRGIAVDLSGKVYIAGGTQSTDFPTVSPFQGGYGGGAYDAFITKLDLSSSTFLYFTYLGGSDWDQSFDIAVDTSGNAYVTGVTKSNDFPIVPLIPGGYSGGDDVFVTKIDSSGAILSYSMFLGGSGDDIAYAYSDTIAVDSVGNAYVTGYTFSADFPTESPLQESNKGGADVFVTKIGRESDYVYIDADSNGCSSVFKLTASDGAAGDHFGFPVSILGDRAIVGSPWDDDMGSDSGSVYIFHYDGASWVEEAKLTASDGAAGDHFGMSISISIDWVVVGASDTDDLGVISGSVYIFHYDGTNWVEETKLTASDGAAGDRFGTSVSISGNRVFVGSPWDDDHGSLSGSAYIFHFDGTNWVEETKLTASDGAADDHFGEIVSISGNRAVVGVHTDDDLGENSGSVYIFHYDGASWVEEAKLTASDGAADDQFGESVSISGNRVVVGADHGDGLVSDSGSAYIFHYDGTNWVEEAILTASDGAANDWFGNFASISGDRVVIGARTHDDSGVDSGSAYIFHYDGTNWTEEAKLTACDGAANDWFGMSVSISGNRTIVGAYWDDDLGVDSGSAYIFQNNYNCTDVDGDGYYAEEGCCTEVDCDDNDPDVYPGSSCDDGDGCTTNDICSDGVCVGGLPLDCNDGDFCNGAETCDATLGCQPGPPSPLTCMAKTNVQDWVTEYNGLGDGDDEAWDIVVDASGNVFVTGNSIGIGLSKDYVTIKYDTVGNEEWVRRYDGPGNGDDNARSLAVDDSGNVYVTGNSIGSGTSQDYTTIKYDTDGNKKWVQRYDGPANSNDEARALAVDVLGNVYITGSSKERDTSQSAFDYTTIKYDTDGNEKWIRRHNGTGNDQAHGLDIAVDAAGNVYVTGTSHECGEDNNYTTIKYDTDGNEQWVRSYNGPGNARDTAWAVKVDTLGNVYVTGRAEGIETSNFDFTTIKYDTDGNEKWVRSYNGPGNEVDDAWTLEVDANSNVYVSGISYGGTETGYDYATIKYDTEGNEEWVRRYNGPGNGSERSYSSAIDASGNVYITGYSTGVDTLRDYTTIKYCPDGNEMWVQTFNGSGSGDDHALSLAVDATGNVYVTGNSSGDGTSLDYVTVKYSVCTDTDGDGYCSDAVCDDLIDCDDNDPNNFPGNTEVCDGQDNDCDGSTDENFPTLGDSCTEGLGACQSAGNI